MKRVLFIVLVIVAASWTQASLFASGGQETDLSSKDMNAMPGVPVVELIYLDHGPVRKVVTDIEESLVGYGESICFVRYTFGSPEGDAFAESMKLEGHIPLAIFIDGSMEYKLDNRSVEFISFPQGQGTGFVEDGAWSVDDLKQVIDGILEQS